MVIPAPDPDQFSLYIHIPFCTRKCGYCHFYVVADDVARQRPLVEAIKAQWRHWKARCAGKKLVSLYFGGGTPSLLDPALIGEIVEAVAAEGHETAAAEVTLEANPETMSRQRAAAYRAAGVNRMSFGVQSLDDSQLELLTRRHTAKEAVAAIHAAAEEIPSLTIDLMYELPGQELESWRRTLAAAAALPIQHLSLYNLTFEPETTFYRRRRQLEAQLPNEEIAKEMYLSAVDALGAAGLCQYELSAFAKEGFFSRHNSGYWLGRPFLGFGPSAFSDWEGSRFQQVADLRGYCRRVEQTGDATEFSETLPPESRRRELLALALRLKQGVELPSFERLRGSCDAETRAALAEMTAIGLLELEGERYRLTRRGFLFYDEVAAALI